jgi:hypothetical protein
MSQPMDRRRFLERSALAAGSLALGASPFGCGGAPDPPPDDGWRRGIVRHLLPTVAADRIRLKASFVDPLLQAPLLVVGSRGVPGQKTDTAGLHWAFDMQGLAPGETHELRLGTASGRALCDGWPRRTFPAAGGLPPRFRLLCYTCAGGPELLSLAGRSFGFLPIATRQRLLARALSFEPDAVDANGDHVYWDLRSRCGWATGRSLPARLRVGVFDRSAPILGTANEPVLLRAFAPQIADLYGVRLRSVPVFFLQDDHDYSENDEATDTLRTLPPDAFMVDVARTTQRLFYPELLADRTLPRGRISRGGRSESFCRLRYGRLFEALLYDCRRHLTNSADPALGDRSAAFLPPDVERWLVSRTQGSDAAHLVHMPSTPVLWTAGKWAEWYPDAKHGDGLLRADAGKPFWPDGWLEQHDRLLAAAASRDDRTPLFVSGDLHATAAGRIHRSGARRFDANPVVSVLCGTLATATGGWPSQFRGQLPRPSGALDAEEWLAPIEENGFSLLDVEPDVLRVSLFRWRPADGPAALDVLEPFRVIELPRPRLT